MKSPGHSRQRRPGVVSSPAGTEAEKAKQRRAPLSGASAHVRQRMPTGTAENRAAVSQILNRRVVDGMACVYGKFLTHSRQPHHLLDELITSDEVCALTYGV